jgi:hypothetical protein
MKFLPAQRIKSVMGKLQDSKTGKKASFTISSPTIGANKREIFSPYPEDSFL